MKTTTQRSPRPARRRRQERHARSSAKRFILLGSILAAAVTVAGSASAASYYWDVNGPTTGSGVTTGGIYSWDTGADAFWSTDPLGLSATSAWTGTTSDSAVFGAGTDGLGIRYTVNLSNGSLMNVGALKFEEGFPTLFAATAADGLNFGTGPITIDVATGAQATIGGVAGSSALNGTGGFTKTGTGSVVLSSANTFTGQTTIEQGAVVLSNGLGLGSDSSIILVNGFAGRGVQGGQLVLTNGITLARSVALGGRGPATDGVVLLNVGDNTISGNLYFKDLIFSQTNVGFATGTATISGNVEMSSTSSTNSLVFQGNGNSIISGAIGGGNSLNTAGLDKAGTGTLTLTNVNNANFGRWQIDGGTIRVDNGGELGKSVRSDAVIPNGGFLEIRSDAGNTFSGVILQANNNSAALFVDRGVAAIGSLNQTVLLTSYQSNNNLTSTINGRNGVNLTVPTVTAGVGANGTGLTWAGNGLFTLGSYTAGSTGTSMGLTFTTTGDALITGTYGSTGSGATPNFNKAGTGMLTLLGSTNTNTATVPFTIANGTLSVANLTNASTSGAGGGINIGTGSTTGSLIFLGGGGGALYGGSGSGDTDARVLNLNGTANDIIFANQTGSAPGALTISNLTATGVAQTLYLAGSNALQNTISGVLPANTTAVGKGGLGTWVLSGNNLYAGLTAVYGGNLIIDASAATGASTKLADAGAIVFNTDSTSVAASATASLGGWTGSQTAGGTFTYKGSASAGGSQEVVGALTPSGGSGNVVIDPTSNSATVLKFASLGARAAGATLNFDQAAGGIQFGTTLPTLSSGIIGGYAYLTNRTAGAITGVDFATVSVLSTNLSAASYTALPTGASTSTVNYNLTASQTDTTAQVVNSLKIVGAATPTALTLGGNLTFTTNPGGLLFDNTSGAGSISGAFTIGTATQELVVITAGGTPGNALTINSAIGTTTGGFTKAGSGTLLLTGNSSAFTGGLSLNEGITRLSGATSNLLGTISSAGNITAIRQTATLDLGGAGFPLSPYGTMAAIPTVNLGALTGGGANVPVLSAQTTTTGAATTNSSTITVLSATGIALGQVVTGLGGAGIGGYPVVTGISGTTITLSSPQTLASGATLNFVTNTTTGATITNSTGPSAVALGIAASTGTTAYSGLIQDGTGGAATTVIVNGTAARFQALTGYNTYSGPTIISGGATLRVTNLANGLVPSSIGASSNAAANLVFNSGILQYIGGTNANGNIYQNTETPSVAIDRSFTIAGAATIDSSGTVGNNFLTASGADNAALVFNGTAPVSYVGTSVAARVLTLTGSSTGDNEIDLQLVNNGSTINSLGVTKAGAGLWILGNNSPGNAYTGLTTLTLGTLRATDGTSLPTNSPVLVNGGVLESSGSFSRALLTTLPTATSATGGIFWNATGGGFAASTGKLTISLTKTAGATPVQWAGTGVNAGFVQNAQVLTFGSATSLAETNFATDVDLNGAVRAITTVDNTTTGADFTTLSGSFSSSTGTGGLSLTAGAPIVLKGASTYNGTTTLNAGEIRVTSLGNSALGGTSALGTPSAATTAALLVGNGTTTGATFTYVGAGETSDRAITLNISVATDTIDASGSGPLKLTGIFTAGVAAGAKSLTLQGLNVDANEITQSLADNVGGAGVLSVNKNGGGLWVLSGNNTFTGTLTLNNGILGLGSDTAAGATQLLLNNGQVQAFNGDRTIGTLLNIGNNISAAFVGNNSLTFTNVAGTSGGGNGTTLLNYITTPGKAVTFGNGTLGLALNYAVNITNNLQGPGAWVINGAITQTLNAGLTYTGVGGGSLTLGGGGTNTITGTFTHNSGTISINRTGAFTSNSNYAFVAGTLQNISGTPLTGGNALIPALLTSGANAGQPGIFNVNGTNLFLAGSGANASIEFAGQFNNAGASNRIIYDIMTGGAALNLSGTVNLSSDTTNRILTIGGASGQINLTGQIQPSSAANFTNLGGTLLKNSTGDLNISQPATTLSQPYAATLFVNGGSATFNSASTVPFTLSRIDLGAGGTLNLDDSTNNVTGRLGTSPFRSLESNGGTINFTANTTSGTAETVGTLYLGNAAGFGGGTTVNLLNGGSAASSLSFGGLIQNTLTTLNVVVPSLGTTNKVFLPGLLSTGLFGINPRVLANGTDYATNGANGVVAYAGYVATNNLDNTGFLSILPQIDNFSVSSATPTFTGATITGQNKTLNSLRLSGTGSTVGAGMYTLTVNSGGILATGTGGQITAPVLAFGAAEGIIQAASGSDVTITSGVTGSGGLTIGGGSTGVVTLSGPLFYSGTTAINGGKLRTGAAFPVLPTAAVPALTGLVINGGILDLNGTNQMVGTINSPDLVVGAAGNITNSSTTTQVRLYTNTGSAQTFSGSIGNAVGGDLSIYKTGNNTWTLTNASTYTGTTTIAVGTLSLRDSGTLSGTTGVTVNGGGVLLFDNTGNADSSSRINASAPITMNGGTIQINGAQTSISQQSIGLVTAASGLNVLNGTVVSGGGAFLSLAGLTRTAGSGSTVNFTGTNLGQPVVNGNANVSRILIGNQAAGFLGGWAVVGGTEFATYSTAIDTSLTPNLAQGVTALVSYVNTADSTWLSGDNVKVVNPTAANPSLYTLTGSRTINSINIQSTTNPITLVNPGTLTLGSGGLLSNGVAGTNVSGGILTAGLTSGAAELFVMDNVNTTITAQITNNGAGGVVSVVKGLGGTTTLSPTVSNTYGGTTTVNTGILTFGSLAGIVDIPQALVVTNANVTFTQAQQIASGKNVSLAAAGTITFVGSNTLGNVLITGNGGGSSPTLTGGTLTMGLLTAANDNAATVPTVASGIELGGTTLTINTSGLSADDLVLSGVVSNATGTAGLSKGGLGSLVLSSANTFNGGVSVGLGSLILANSTTVASLTNSTTVTGSGALTVSSTSGLAVGMSVTGTNIPAGAVITAIQGATTLLLSTAATGAAANTTVTIGTSNTIGTGALTLADGTALFSGTALVSLANPVTVNGNITLGAAAAANNIALSGAIALGTTARAITVASPAGTATLTGTLSGTQPLTKSGLGTLAFASSTLNYSPGLIVSNGVLALDQSLSSFSAPIAVSAGAMVSLNSTAAGTLGVSVNPSGVPLAISGAGQVIKTGAFALNTYGNFTYTGSTNVQAGSLILAPNAITNAAPTFTASSMVDLGGVGAVFGLDNAGATAAISVGNASTAINFLARDTVIQSTRSVDFGSTLTLGAVTRAAGATGIFNYINNVTYQPAADDSVVSNAATGTKIIVGGSTGVIDPGIYITTGNLTVPLVRTDFAYRDATGLVRSVGYGVDAGTSFSAGVTPVTATGGNFKITGSVTSAAVLSSTAAPNTALLFGQNANLTLAAGTNFLNGILRTGAGANPALLLINGAPAYTSVMSTLSGGTISNNGNELLIRADSVNDWLTINNKITGAGGLTRTGAGSLIIGGTVANDYSGNTLIAGATTTYLNKTGGAVAIPGNLLIGDGTGTTVVQFGLANNASGLSNQIATTSVVTFNGSNTLSLNGSSQTLAGLQTLTGSPIIQNASVSGDVSSTLTINNTTDYNLGAGSTLRDGATAQYANLALVKQGSGKLTVGIVSSTGGVDVQGGVLSFGAVTAPAQVVIGTGASSFGTGFLNVASGATVDIPLDVTVDSLTGAGTIINTGTAAKTLTIGNLNNTNMATGATSAATFGGVISDGTNGGVVVVQKRGAGTETFTAAQNFTAGLDVQGGTLVLDFTGLTSNPVNLIRSQNALNLGGVLSLKGNGAGATSQTFNGTNFLGGASNILINSNGGTSTTLTLGAITRSANGTVDFPVTSATSVVNTSTTLVNGILGGYATYNGLDWATTTSSAIGQYSGYTSGLPVSGSTATVNYLDTTTGVTTTAAESVNTLKLAPTAAQTMVLGGILTLTSNGVLFDNSLAASTISNGGTAANTLGAAAVEVIVTVNGTTPANALTISALIGGTTGTLTKAGTGTLVLSGANAYTGATRINEGTVSFATVAAAAAAQPLGAGTLVLGGTSKTATLNYTGATATTWTQLVSLGDAGVGQFSLTNGAISTLTVGGVVSGGGALTLLTPTTSGSGLIFAGTNTYLGVTTIQSGAKLSLNNSAGLGASGTIANGTVIQSGGVLDLQDTRITADVITVNGTGIGGTGAITYSGATNDESDANISLRSLILGSNSTIASTGGKQIAIGNGFIQGAGNSLTVGGTNFLWLINETIDNVPSISVSSSLVVENMVLGGGSTQSLNLTGAGKGIQFRTGTVDRAINFTNNTTPFIQFSTKGGDNFVTQNVTVTNASASTLSLTGGGSATISINANILQGGAGAVTVSRTGGFIVLGGTANTFTGGLTSTLAGTLKLMPTGAATNPFATANTVNFNATGFVASIASAALPFSEQVFVLDNSKAGGNVSQSFGNLTTTAGLGPIVQLNNSGAGTLSLVFSGVTRPVGSDFLLGITGSNTTPSGTNRLDITSITAGTVNPGIFWNGSDYAYRDANGGSNQFLRPVNYGVDTGTNLVTTGAASFTNVGAATDYSKITGTVTAQITATIGTLNLGAGGSLTLGAAQTLTLGTAGLLKSGGGAAATITGGTALQFGTASTTDAIVRVDTINDSLSLNTPVSFFNTTGQTLTKLGLGQLILGAASGATFTTNVNEGTLRLAATNALGTLATNTVSVARYGALELANGVTIPNNLTIGITTNDSQGFMGENTGTLRNIGGNNTVNGTLTSTGFNRIDSDAGLLTLSALGTASTTTFGGVSAPGTVAGSILVTGSSGAGAIAHDGTGTVTIKTTVASAATGLAIQGGTTILDFSNMTTPTNMFLGTDTLTARGAILQLVGKTAAVATAQSFTTFTQADGITRLQGTNNGTSLTLTLGAYALPTGFATIDFLPSANVTYAATAGGAAVNNNGILGTAALNGFATAGNDWAVVNGTSLVNYVANGGIYTPLPATGGVGTSNYSLAGSQTVTATEALNSLKFDATGGAASLSVNAGVQVNANAFLIAGSNNVTWTGGGTVGSTTVNNYVQHQGSGNLIIDTPVADNSGAVGVALIFAGTGTGGIQITSSGSIVMASNANIDSIYFEGGTPGTPRTVSNAGSITFNSKGSLDIAHTGTDSVVFTNTGAISVTTGTFNVGNTAGAFGKYIQSGTTSTFSSLVPTLFANNATAFVSGGNGGPYGAAGSAAFDLQSGTFSVGGSTGVGIYTVFGTIGNFVGTQEGGTITLNRPGNLAFLIGQEGTYGATSSFSQTGGVLSVLGATLVGVRTGAIGSYSLSGTAVANFNQGLILGLQDFAQGSFTQSGGTVNIGTGQNISDANLVRGNNTVDLVLAYNQTTNAGAPSTTRGTYNLNGGSLFVNGITTGQGNGYTTSAAAPGTFTDGANVYTTTSGGTAIFNLGGGLLSPFDTELTVGSGVNVVLTASGSTISSSDKSGVGRLVTFNTPISESGGSRGLVFSGLGSTQLNGADTFTGGVTINGGALRLGNAGALNASAPNAVAFGAGVAAGTRLGLNGNSVTIAGLTSNTTPGSPVVENASVTAATLTVANTSANTFAGVLQDGAGGGALSLIKGGGGNLTLSGINTYTGTTAVNLGTLTVNGSLAAGSSVTVAGGAILSGNGTVNGPTTVSSTGIVTAGSAGSGALTLGNLTFSNLGTINTGDVADTVNQAFLTTSGLTLGGGSGSITINVAAGTPYANGGIYKLIGYSTLGGTGFPAFVKGTVGGLSGRQSASITQGTNEIDLTIGGDSPVWTGYDAGHSTISSAWKIDPTTTNWVLSSDHVTPTDFRLNDAVIFDDTVLTAAPGGTSGTTTVDISGADVVPSSVTFANVSATYTLQGSNGISGSAGLVLNGAGQVIINNANSFTGGVSINAGTLTIGNSNALGTVNIVAFGASSNGKLQLNNNSITLTGLSGDSTAIVENGGSTDSVLTLNVAQLSGNQALLVNNVFGGTLRDGSGAGKLGLTKLGLGTVILTGTNTYTGPTLISAGALQIGNNGTTGSILGNVTDNGSLVFNRTNSVTYPGTVTGSGTVTVSTGTVVLNGGPGTGLANSGTNTVSSGAILQVGDGATNGVVGNVTDNGAVNFNVNGSAAYSGTVSGSGAVAVLAGTVVLTGGFNNSGTITVNSGAILQVGNTTTNGTLGGNVTDNGTVNFNLNATPLTYANAISGGGALAVNNGTLILTSGSSYTGGTTIATGATLQIGANTTTGSITGDVADNGSFVFARSNGASYTGTISGSGALVVGAAGGAAQVLTLSPGAAASTFNGGTFIQKGTLKLGATNVLPTGGLVTIGSSGTAGTLDLNSFNQTLPGLASAGTGGSQTITNNSTVSNSTLTINGTGSTYGGTFKDGASKKVILVINGGGSLGLSGTASLSTFTSPTAVQNGTLKVGALNGGAAATLVTLGSASANGAVDVNGLLSTTGGFGGVTVDPSVSSGNVAAQIVGNSSSSPGALVLSPVTPATFAGTIEDGGIGGGTGTTALTVVSGTQILTGANTYTGGTNISAGATLQVGAGGTAGSIAGTLTGVNAGTFILNHPSGFVLTSPIALSGAGAIYFSNPVAVASDNQINTSNALLFGLTPGSTTLGNVDLTNGSATFGGLTAQTNSNSNNTITLPTGKTLTVNGGGNVGFTALATGLTSNVVVTGGNYVQNLAGNTLNIGLHTTTTPTGAAGVVGLLDLSATAGTSITGTAASSILLGSNTTPGSNAASDVTQGFLKLSSGGTNSVSTGTLTLGTSPASGFAGIQGFVVLGNGANNFSVDTTYVGRQKSQLNGTLLNLISFAGTGGTLTLGGLSSAKATLNIGYNDVVNTGTVSAGKVDLTNGSFNGTLGQLNIGFTSTGGTGVGGGQGTLVMPAGTATADGVNLAVTNSAAASFVNTTGTLGLSGGLFSINSGGTGVVGGNGVATVNLSGTGTLELANTPITLAGAGSAFNLTGGTLSNVSTFSVAGSGTLTDSGALVQRTIAGTTTLGTLAFTGSGTSPSLLVNTGTVSVSGSGITSANSGSVVRVEGGTLNLNATTLAAGSLFYRSGSILNVAAGGATLSSTTNPLLALRDTNVNFAVALSGGPTSSASGDIHFENATGGASGGTISSTVNLGGVNRIINVDDSSAAAVDLTVSGAISNGSVIKNGAGTLLLSASNSYTGTTTLNSGITQINSSTSLGNGGAATVNNATLEVLNNVTSGRNLVLGDPNSTILVDPSATYTLSGTVSGTGNLNKSGAGTLALNGTDTFTGVASTINVTAGTVALGGSLSGTTNVNVSHSATFSVAATASIVPVALVDSGVVVYNNTATTLTSLGGTDASALLSLLGPTALTINASGAYAGAISGAGSSLTIAGGTQTLTGTNTYTGATTINSGATLQLGDGTTDGTIGTTSGIANNGALLLNRTGTITTPAVITGSGSVAVLGTGTQILTGLSSFSGPTTIAVGSTLQLGDGTTDGNLTATSGIANSGRLIYKPATSVTTSAQITGSGSLVVNGPGIVALTGNNQYLGGTVINGGTVQINSATSLGDSSGLATLNNATIETTQSFTSGRAYSLGDPNSALSVDAGKTFTLNGNINGSGALNVTGPGTLALGGSNTYAGPTNIKSGTLAALASGSISGNINITSGASFDVTALGGGYTLPASRTLATVGAGTATVTGTLTGATSSTVSPGGANALGSLAVTGGLTLSGTLAADLAPGASDLITTPSLTLSGATLSLGLIGGFQPNGDGSLYTLINNTGASAISGVFAGTVPMSFGSAFGGQTFATVQAPDGEYFAVSYTGDAGTSSFTGGNDVVLMAVPEPSAVGSLLAGLASLAGLQRFRRRTARSAR